MELASGSGDKGRDKRFDGFFFGIGEEQGKELRHKGVNVPGEAETGLRGMGSGLVFKRLVEKVKSRLESRVLQHTASGVREDVGRGEREADQTHQ